MRNKLIVDGAIDNQKVGILLDTGANVTLIPRATTNKLGLVRQKARGYRMFGGGGETEVEWAFVEEFKIGQAVVKRRRMMVAGERELGDGVAVILGEDFFHEIDVEFDLAHDTVRLFQAKDCDGVSLAYWGLAGASEVAIEAIDEDRPAIIVSAQINGRPVRTLLDSGGGVSILNKAEAVRLGIPTEEAGTSTAAVVGIGPKAIQARVAQVESFTIGDETIRDTAIEVASVFAGRSQPDSGGSGKVALAMLLGADFLRAHRVLVAQASARCTSPTSVDPCSCELRRQSLLPRARRKSSDPSAVAIWQADSLTTSRR